MNAYVSVLVTEVLPVVQPLVVTLAGVAIAYAVKLLAAHSPIQLSAAMQAKMNTLADNAIGRAEQWAVNQVAPAAGAAPVAGADKLKQALIFLKAEMDKTGILPKAEADLVALIEGRLGLANIAAGS
jgi:hypothetical protein